MFSQKIIRWLSKNFDLQGLVRFPGAKAYIRYVEVLKKRRNAEGRTFCDAIWDDKWTRSIAVGSKEFVDKVKSKLGILAKSRDVTETDGGYQLRESTES